MFHEEGVITEWKNISGKIWFFKNCCQTIYPMFLMTIFSENDDFVRETKIVPWEKNTVKVKEARGKWQYFKCGGNRMGKKRQNSKFRTFYWKFRGETNSTWPNKSAMNNRTFTETTSLRCYAGRLICNIFKIKENIIAVLRCWKGRMTVLFVQLTKKGLKPGTPASSA
jgi:hypothetical protein